MGSRDEASRIVEGQWVARDRNLQRFVTKQSAYSLLVRRIEEDILSTCRRHGMRAVLQPADRRRRCGHARQRAPDRADAGRAAIQLAASGALRAHPPSRLERVRASL